MNTTPALSLFELNALVRQTIEQRLNREYWVEAELSECRESRGHCYMELIQKDPRSATPIARAQARCWRSQWQLLQPYFERTTGQTLHAGLKVLLKVYAQFHEAFGFSWIVTDIDPTFTLGDMARRRQEIIHQLKQEGVFDLQKELALPVFCQRIAVISSATAAGYGDFVKQLNENTFGLHFQVTLFPAIMQGEQVEASGISALDSIYEYHTQTAPFDVVCILRGGGATADLSGFDTLALAENVAQFPLPIITGIGHDRDESILDMVANTRVKTPTAAAALLIYNLHRVLTRIEQAESFLSHYVSERIRLHQQRISQLSRLIPTLALRTISDGRHHIEMLAVRPPVAIQRLLTEQRHLLERIALRLEGFDPQILLARGYSITLKDGRAVRDAQQLQTGDEIETRVEKGTFKSIVK